MKVTDDTYADADTMNSAPSPYPVVMIRGKSIFDPLEQVSVVLEKKIIIKADDVLEGIKTDFASYYVFGYAYPAALSKSLEFLQRLIFEINPPVVADKREKEAKRRLRSFDTQVKDLMATLEGIVKTL